MLQSGEFEARAELHVVMATTRGPYTPRRCAPPLFIEGTSN